MPWIESHTTLRRNHKLRRLSVFLDIEPVHVMGHLHCLWHNVLELREDGDISAWTPSEIAHYAEYKGDSNKFYEALRDGWIDEFNGFILIHDWLIYAGRYLQTRYRSAKPEKWKSIKEKYASLTAQSDNLPNLPNLPNLNSSVEDELNLVELLKTKILENNPEAKISSSYKENWGKHLDLMIRRDKRTPEKIKEVIEWCQASNFWRSNILSFGKLREKFDALVLKTKGNQSTKQFSGKDATDNAEAKRLFE